MVDKAYWPFDSPPPRYKPIYARTVQELARIGATNAEIIRHLQINSEVLLLWTMAYPDFSRAMRANVEARNARVEDAMYHRSLGYDVPYEKITKDGEGNIIKKEIGATHIPPDSNAGYKWLSACSPEKWAKSGDEDKKDLHITVTGGLPERKME